MALGLQEENHGGHTALGCMQILVNAMNSNLGDDDAAKEDNAESIAALADLLYHQAGTFCDCAAKASDSCPLCSSFVHVKTLLYESLDACQSLDEIDCDAWMEFHAPCKDKILSKFGSVDFNSDEQCKFGWGIGFYMGLKVRCLSSFFPRHFRFLRTRRMRRSRTISSVQET